MNPKPIRLPFDIEVCGTEVVKTVASGPLKFAFIAGVSADLKWDNAETLAIFDIIGSVQCPIRSLKLMDIRKDQPLEMSSTFDDNIIMKPMINGTEDGLWIKNNIKEDT